MMLIEYMDFVVRFIELPASIRAFTAIDEDGRANIYINQRMPSACWTSAFGHEIRHVQRGDFFNDDAIRIVESC